jgi:hypothetical protein
MPLAALEVLAVVGTAVFIASLRDGLGSGGIEFGAVHTHLLHVRIRRDARNEKKGVWRRVVLPKT